MKNYKNYFKNLITESMQAALSAEVTPPPIHVTKVTYENEETQSDQSKFKTHRTLMGVLSELIFPLCVTDYFVTNNTSTEDILNALQHIILTKEKTFVLFDSDVSESSSLFLSKSEDMKAKLLANRKKEVKPSNLEEPSIKEYSESKSEELFKELGISSEVTSLKTKILNHFLQYKDSEDASQYRFEGKEEMGNYTVIYLSHLYRSKQHAGVGQKESDALRWYRERSQGIATEINKPEIAFADTKIIKQGRGGVSVALRLIIIPHGTLNESSNQVAFKMEDSKDSLKISLTVNYSEDFLSDLELILSDPQHEKFSELIGMIETYLGHIQDVPEIVDAREYLEHLTSNSEIDFIDLNIRASGSMGAHEGGLSGNIKKDADLKIVEFESINRKGIKETKTFSFSLKASDRKDVGIIQFNEKWKAEMEWIFDLCDLDFTKLNWDRHAPSGDSESIMENMKKYFTTVQKTHNDKLVKFMFSMLDLFAHGHEDSTVISISQSRKDMKVFSNIISEYIRARKIYVSVLDMNDQASVETYYKRVEKRKQEAKRGRKPSQGLKQFLLQLTDDSEDSFGVFRLVQSQSRRAGANLEEARGRPKADVVFNPYKIVIDDELDDLCQKLSKDLKDERRRKLWSINRVFRRIYLMEKLIQKNQGNINLLNQYREILESFNGVLQQFSQRADLQTEFVDNKLMERILLDKTFELSRMYIDEYAFIKDYMLESKALPKEQEPLLAKFYGTALAYGRQKAMKLIRQLQGGSYPQ